MNDDIENIVKAAWHLLQVMREEYTDKYIAQMEKDCGDLGEPVTAMLNLERMFLIRGSNAQLP